MADDTMRVELNGTLKGSYLILDPDALTFGLLEDLQSGQTGAMLDALAAAIVGGDLPKGTDRKGLRQLRIDAMKSVIEGVGSAFELPKRIEK